MALLILLEDASYPELVFTLSSSLLRLRFYLSRPWQSHNDLGDLRCIKFQVAVFSRMGSHCSSWNESLSSFVSVWLYVLLRHTISERAHLLVSMIVGNYQTRRAKFHRVNAMQFCFVLGSIQDRNQRSLGWTMSVNLYACNNVASERIFIKFDTACPHRNIPV